MISFDSAIGSSSGSSRVITDRVRAATAAYAARLDRQERGLSISDVIGSGTESAAVVSNDPKTLRADLAQARRQIEKIHAARFTPLHPKETVKNIFFGQPYSLELYKSFNDKVALIDEALSLGDGNAILAVRLARKVHDDPLHVCLLLGVAVSDANIVQVQTARNLGDKASCREPLGGLLPKKESLPGPERPPDGHREVRRGCDCVLSTGYPA